LQDKWLRERDIHIEKGNAKSVKEYTARIISQVKNIEDKDDEE
tara:strand:- start:563 stop:691 length:129 start_codon:yes stop_codon:yes gene_type:complete